MKKMFACLMVALMCAGAVYAQRPVASVRSIAREGTPLEVVNASFSVYNAVADTTATVTIVSSDTNVFTVSPAATNITGTPQTVTLTFATGLAEGNYKANVVIAQATPARTVTVPVTLRIVNPIRLALGSLGDARIIQHTVPGDVSPTTVLPPARYYGDMILGKVSLTDQSGDAHTRMNMWVWDGSDYGSVAGEVYTAVQLAGQQRDTNTTTTTTAYTPRYFGDILVGQTGSGTGSLWVAVGLTTNDWSEIE